MKRYDNNKIISVDINNELYRSVLEKRNIKSISFYKSRFYNLDDTSKNLNFTIKEERWKEGEKLYKLSKKYYNSVNYWWVIGFFNQKPTDSDYSIGDLVLVPYPLEEFLDFIGAL